VDAESLVMEFWLPALVLLFAVTAALALGSKWLARASLGAGTDAGLTVFKHQLKELDSDIDAGRIASADGDGLRNELSRRILAAARGQTDAAVGNASPRVMALALLVPLATVLIYVQVGKPNMPDVPRAERLANAQKTGDPEALVAQVEDHLSKKPDDVQGWQLLVPVYMEMQRFGDAAAAQMQIMALTGETAELKAGVAEALTLRDKGLMPELAITAAMDAYRLDPANPKTQFYHALALSQQGKKVESLVAFNAILANSSADAPWRGAVQEQIKRLSSSGAAPQISEDQAAGLKNLAPADQQAMIRGMVDGLDAKLAANADDLEGWLRLIRARTVLGESDKASAALTKARRLFVSKPDALTAINDLAKELKLP
jgi:cytochrome c-type biogenesis protein CcmH